VPSQIQRTQAASLNTVSVIPQEFGKMRARQNRQTSDTRV